MFTLKNMLQSDWYAERLKTRRQRDQELWQRHVSYLQNVLAQSESGSGTSGLDLNARLQDAKAQLARVSSSDYLKELHGCIGADRLR